MPLEDMTGPNKTLGALVPANPLDGEFVKEGDDHIRGMKNTIRNTFPNIPSDGGFVNPDPDEFNVLVGVDTTGDLQSQLDSKAPLELGTNMIFRQAAVPTGWSIENLGGLIDAMLRGVGPGGFDTGFGGNWNNATGLTTSNDSHTHNFNFSGVTGAANSAAGGAGFDGGGAGHNHPFSVNGATTSDTHNHNITSAETWRPRYANVVSGTRVL